MLTTDIAIHAADKLFVLGRTRSAGAEYSPDRHRRSARTHMLHAPIPRTFGGTGNHALNGVNPPVRSWI